MPPSRCPTARPASACALAIVSSAKMPATLLPSHEQHADEYRNEFVFMRAVCTCSFSLTASGGYSKVEINLALPPPPSATSDDPPEEYGIVESAGRVANSGAHVNRCLPLIDGTSNKPDQIREAFGSARYDRTRCRLPALGSLPAPDRTTHEHSRDMSSVVTGVGG